MNDIKLSIIIPVYNAVNYIDRLFDFFEMKDYPFELVFIDDCSNDGSYERLLNKAEESKIQTIVMKNSTNSGAGITRNQGIDKANGEYITFVDSDDLLSDDYFDVIIPLLKCEYDMLVYDAYVVENDNDNRVLSMFYSRICDGLLDKKLAIALIRGCTWGKVYKRDLVLDNGIRFLDLTRNEDMPFSKIAASKAERIFYLSKPLYLYNQNPYSLMHNKSLLTPKNAQKSFDYVKRSIGVEFPDETEAIFLVEYLYSTVLTNANQMSNKELRLYIDASERLFPMCYKNKYFNMFTMKLKFVLKLIQHKQLFALKMIEKLKS